MDASAFYNPVNKYHWNFVIPGKSNISFETFCTGIQAICVFAGVILFTPHSQDDDTNRDIIWRKTKSLIISSVIFYVVNIIRMLIQIQLYNIGYAWEDIHFSISAASSFIAAIIVLLMHKWIPEFIISIIYIGTLISEPIKHNRKERVREIVRKTSKVEIGVMRKILRLEKKTFSKDIVSWSKEYGYKIEGDFVVIPDEKISSFINLLMQEKPFKKDSLSK
jgi:exosortase/archaeosortase family protein